MSPASRAAADLVVLATTVHTLDPEGRQAAAVAVRDGVIVGLGSHADMRELIGAATRVVAGPGLVVTPGLVDAHQHPVLGLSQSRGVDLSSARTIDDVRHLLHVERTRLTDDEWLIGYGLDYDAVSRPLHRKLIDDIADGRPAWLWMFDLHTVLLSTEALRRAGVTGAIGFGDRAEIVLDDAGTPTGEVREMSAIAHVHRALPAPTRAESARRLRELFAEHNRKGLTGIHVPDMWSGTEELLDALEDADDLSLRVRVAPWVRADEVNESIAEAAALRDRRQKPGALWTAGALKFFLDGTVDGGTAWLGKPDCHGESTQAQWLHPQEYAAAVHKAVGTGLSCWTHAIGDAAVGFALDVYQRAGRPVVGRHRIEHVEVLGDHDVRRFAELDVVASMQPTHMDWSQPDHSDNWSRRLGRERCANAWRYKQIAAAGGTIAFGSDWPIADPDPRVIMAGARLRRPVSESGRAPYDRGREVGGLDALMAMTVGAARAIGEEATTGHLRVGMRADLTVFDGDPLVCSADELPELPVTATIVDGRPVHDTVR